MDMDMLWICYGYGHRGWRERSEIASSRYPDIPISRYPADSSRYPDIPICRYGRGGRRAIPISRYPDIVGYWDIGILGYWDIGILGYWAIGLLGYWAIGLLGYWDMGIWGSRAVSTPAAEADWEVTSLPIPTFSKLSHLSVLPTLPSLQRTTSNAY